MGILSSQQGVHQGDPLGPFIFALVLQKLVSAIGNENNGLELGPQCWYIDDGVLAGRSRSVLRALTIIQQLGPSLGLKINLKKCQLFGAGDLSQFPSCIPSSHIPNFELLGSPIGDDVFCSQFITMKISAASALLSHIQEVGSTDSHVAFVLLRFCAGFSKLSYITRTTPPTMASEALKQFDNLVQHCFSECFGIDTTTESRLQAQLSPSRGG